VSFLFTAHAAGNEVQCSRCQQKLTPGFETVRSKLSDPVPANDFLELRSPGLYCRGSGGPGRSSLINTSA
jgi:hypothetical protein